MNNDFLIPISHSPYIVPANLRAPLAPAQVGLQYIFLEKMKRGSYSFQVSWVRKSDAHILTVDQFSYINDDRFFVIPPDSDNAAAATGVVEDSAASVESRPQLLRRRVLPADADDWTLHIRWLELDELMNRSFI